MGEVGNQRLGMSGPQRCKAKIAQLKCSQRQPDVEPEVAEELTAQGDIARQHHQQAQCGQVKQIIDPRIAEKKSAKEQK
ncbi:hypothetical protein [Candidatus Sodalis endolongispinus]|uniref:hypothetical protein n=1 Tax=Candidatus Sodalis endolongispinus TaxID=2812662 RepID=UPI001FEB6D8B|nr:hypothetical protein [Candidatus Sodalis endolongispinus]